MKERRILEELYAAQDVLEYVKELRSQYEAPPRAQSREAGFAERLWRLLDALAVLDALQPGEQGWVWQRVLLLVRGLDDDQPLRTGLAQTLVGNLAFEGGASDSYPGIEFGLEAMRWTPLGPPIEDRSSWHFEDQRPGWLQWVTDPSLRAAYQARHHLDAILLEGQQAVRLLQLQEGTHLFVRDDGHLKPLQVIVLPLEQGQLPQRRLLDCLAEHDRCQYAIARGRTSSLADPFAWQPVVTLYPGHRTPPLCFRSSSRNADLAALLPLPPEFREPTPQTWSMNCWTACIAAMRLRDCSRAASNSRARKPAAAPGSGR